MKVVCIDNKMRKYSYADTSKYLIEGAVYSVVKEDTAICKVTGGIVLGYVLTGFPSDYVFAQDRFAPLSDLDETTLVNEEFEEKYCQPVNHIS